MEAAAKAARAVKVVKAVKAAGAVKAGKATKAIKAATTGRETRPTTPAGADVHARNRISALLRLSMRVRGAARKNSHSNSCRP